MLQDLKRKTLPGKLLEAVVFTVLGVFFMIALGDGIHTLPLLLRGPRDLYSLNVDELEGQYVKAEVYAIYDWYAETTRDNDTVVRREYIIPVGPEEFMGVNVTRSKFDEAEKVMDSTWAVLDGEAEELDGTTFTVTGMVREMDSQTKGFYRETVDYYSMSDGQQELFLPLVLETNQIGGEEKTAVYLSLALFLALTAAGIIRLALAFTGFYQRKILAWCKAQPDPDGARDRLDQFYQSAAQFGKVRVDRELLFCENAAASFLLPVNEIAWVYQTTTQHRTNGIPTGKTFALTVRTSGKKRETYSIPVKAADDALQLMRDLMPYLPHTVFGYKREWERTYNSNPAAFADTLLRQPAAGQTAQAATAAPPAPASHEPPPPAASDAADHLSGHYGGTRVP